MLSSLLKADSIFSHSWVSFPLLKACFVVLFEQSKLAQWDSPSLMETDTQLAPQIYTAGTHKLSSVYKLSYTPTHIFTANK